MCSSSSHSVRGIVCHTGVCTCSLNAATKHAVGRVSVSVAVGRTYKEESRCKSALPLGRSHQPRRFCSHLVRRVPLPLTLYAPSAVGLCSVFPLTPPQHIYITSARFPTLLYHPTTISRHTRLCLSNMQYQVSFAGCPQWLLSAILSTDSKFLACSDQSTTTVDAKPRNASLARTIAPQRTRSLATPPTFYGGRQSLQRPFFVRPTAMPALIRRSPRLDKHCAAGGSRPTSRVRVTPRVAVPLPFPDGCIANRIDFHSRGCRGISLDEWAKLAEKGKTSLGIDDPLEGLDELFSGEEQLLFQSHVSTLSYCASPATRSYTTVAVVAWIRPSDVLHQLAGTRHCRRGGLHQGRCPRYGVPGTRRLGAEAHSTSHLALAPSLVSHLRTPY